MPKASGKQAFYALYNAAEAEEWYRANGGPASMIGPKIEPVSNPPPQRAAPYHRSSRSSSRASPAAGSSVPLSGQSSSRHRDEQIEDETGWDVVFCDGACKGNGQKGSYAGIGVWWGHQDPRNIAERCPGNQTNNRAELIAIARVLENTPISKKPLLIKSDSAYSRDCLHKWLPGWQRNGWKNSKGESVRNQAVIRYILALLAVRGKAGQKVQIQWVKGHAGIAGNEGADAEANLGALLPELPEEDWDAKRVALEIEAIQDTAVSTVTAVARDENHLSIPDAVVSTSANPLSLPLEQTRAETNSGTSTGTSIQSRLANLRGPPESDSSPSAGFSQVNISLTPASNSALVPTADVVYCDGACTGNGNPGSVAGIGVWWGPEDPRNLAERCPGAQTNIRAELIAIIRILEETPFNTAPLLIKTDSEYSINCVNDWMPKWESNGWISSIESPVKNKPVIRYLSALLRARRDAGQQVELQCVQGHANIEGNEAADKQANLGAMRPPVSDPDWDELRVAVEKSRVSSDVFAIHSISLAVSVLSHSRITTVDGDDDEAALKQLRADMNGVDFSDPSGTAFSPPR
ncbi:ribonuclease H-like protein [Punctularia strigosozonata HHB-11173 SS5]|uniref:ribonuclease H-like protein n=1 Tax=Punctularia strigosozonata (strain HHB-11173) TaxID=741275 RepID=UPI00044173B4|nr:ribonuclease H-like protein [Punctularia strigosozonata HHB-11173 SS5]EIN06942.1 ribonuclease H-like protein [Punctularia strigosozonata HHB-11173 SS5]